MSSMRIFVPLRRAEASFFLTSFVMSNLLCCYSTCMGAVSESSEQVTQLVEQKTAAGPLVITDRDQRITIASLGVNYIEGTGLVARYGFAAEGGDPNLGFPLWIEAKYFPRPDIGQFLETKWPRRHGRVPHKDYQTIVHIADTNPIEMLWETGQLTAYALRCRVTDVDASTLQARRFSILVDQPNRPDRHLTTLVGLPGTRFTFDGDPNHPFRFVPGLDLWKGGVDIDPNRGLLIDPGTGFRVSQSKDERRRFNFAKLPTDVDYSSVAMSPICIPSWSSDIIPEEFRGTWSQVGGTDELMITPASVKWRRHIAGRTETYGSRELKLEEKPAKILFIAVPMGRSTSKSPGDQEVKVTIALKTGTISLSTEPANRDEGSRETVKEQAYVRVKLTPAQILKPDANIIMVDEQKESVTVNLGTIDIVWSGLLFAIFDYKQVISPETKPKTTIRISRYGIGEQTSIADIMTTHAYPRGSIRTGDVVLNPIWDRYRSNVVVFAGILDLDSDGFEEYDASVMLTVWVRDSGGSVSKDFSPNTDLVILGAKPKLPSREAITEDLGNTWIAMKVYGTAQERLEHYEHVRSEAQSAQVPILYLKDFASIIGW